MPEQNAEIQTPLGREASELSGVVSCCMDCPSHLVIADPDPNDWFCDDDKAVVCTKVNNPHKDIASRYPANRHVNKIVSCSIRPYNLRKETQVPDWCPDKAR